MAEPNTWRDAGQGAILGPRGWLVAQVNLNNPDAKPGLIAAAPEMYAALADLIEAVMSSDVGFEDYVLQSLFRARRVMTAANPAYENPMPSTPAPL